MLKRFEDILEIINGKNQKQVENPEGKIRSMEVVA